MKGIVFTEFLDMVEKEFGYEMVDKIIEQSDLPSGAIYTSVGTYNHSEIVELIVNLSNNTGTEVGDLLKAFGSYLFKTFLSSYPAFFESCAHGFEFLESIDKHIHVEVRKLYPEAMLPKFITEIQGETLSMKYESERRMSALAEGLIESSMHHFNHEFQIQKETLDENGTEVMFRITSKIG